MSKWIELQQCWGVGYWDDWQHAAVPCYALVDWEKCDCACPEPEKGAAGVSEECPIHGGNFVTITSVM